MDNKHLNGPVWYEDFEAKQSWVHTHALHLLAVWSEAYYVIFMLLSFATESSASLRTGAESNLGDRVWGEAEKGSFITLPGFDEGLCNHDSGWEVCRACTPLTSSQVDELLWPLQSCLRWFPGCSPLISNCSIICPLELKRGHGVWSLACEKWWTKGGFRAQVPLSFSAWEPHRVPLSFSYRLIFLL